MTLNETNRILAIIAEAYPSFLKDRNPKITSELWHELFEKIPYEKVQASLMEFILKDTKGFAPAPGMLRAILLSHMAENDMSEMEAWSLLVKAVSRSAYYSREEYEKLPPVLQDIIRSPQVLHEWAFLNESYLQSTVFPWFCRSFSRRIESEREESLMPSSVMQNLAGERAAVDAGLKHTVLPGGRYNGVLSGFIDKEGVSQYHNLTGIRNTAMQSAADPAGS